LESPIAKNGKVEKCFDGRDAFPWFKLPISSHLFDNNLSPGIEGAPSQKLFSQE
jgi:hypothetical protein